MLKRVFFLISALLLIVSCSKMKKEQALTMQDVFPVQKNTDSTLVISLDAIKTFEKLENLVCRERNNDKDIYVRVKSNDILLHIKSYTKCSHYGCILIKERNIIDIDYNSDSIFYMGKTKSFTVKNYQKILTEQFFNRGKKPGLSYSPEKVVTFLKSVGSFIKDKNKPLNFSNRLDSISISYYNFIKSFNALDKIDSLKNVYPLNLSIKFTIPPPPKIKPPMPSPLETVE